MSKNKIVKCVETGEYFPSLRRAAEKMFPEKHVGWFRKVVAKGKPYKGYHFKIVPQSDNDMILRSEDSICFVCKNTNASRCTWFNPVNPTPVKGWTATKKKLKGGGKGSVNGKIDGYIVKKCPNFAKEDLYRWEVDN